MNESVGVHGCFLMLFIPVFGVLLLCSNSSAARDNTFINMARLCSSDAARNMEMVGRNLQLFVVACVLLLTVVASLAQPTGPDSFVTDLEYTGPESTQPRSDGRFNRDNGQLHPLG